ncbi:MAG TPA: type II secretion system protein GspM [Guyparkeria sp.]|nr:type II secretion system protein GspM [Guyparkeria sp.]
MNMRNIQLIDTLQQKWQAFSVRERRALVVGGLIGAVLTGYFLIWSPAANWATEQQQRLADAATTAAVVAAGRARLEAESSAGQSNRHPSANHSLPVALSPAHSGSAMQQAQQIAVRHDIAGSIQRREPMGDDGLTIRFDSVPFSALSRWINEMSANQLEVTTAELRPETPNAPRGLVDAHLTLARTSR